MAKKLKKVCSACGNEEFWFDATATWNKDTQSVELASVLSHTYCEDCEGTCSVVDIELEEEHKSLNELQKLALLNLEERKGLNGKIENGGLYIIVEEVELELSEYEVRFQANEYLKNLKAEKEVENG